MKNYDVVVVGAGAAGVGQAGRKTNFVHERLGVGDGADLVSAGALPVQVAMFFRGFRNGVMLSHGAGASPAEILHSSRGCGLGSPIADAPQKEVMK